MLIVFHARILFSNPGFHTLRIDVHGHFDQTALWHLDQEPLTVRSLRNALAELLPPIPASRLYSPDHPCRVRGPPDLPTDHPPRDFLTITGSWLLHHSGEKNAKRKSSCNLCPSPEIPQVQDKCKTSRSRCIRVNESGLNANSINSQLKCVHHFCKSLNFEKLLINTSLHNL